MSWSATVPVVEGGAFEAALDAVELPDYAISGETAKECGEQLEAAREAIRSMFRSGAFPGPGLFHASMGGHANPDHKPRSGYANDFVTAALYCDPE